jgi:hypothetical protein
MSPFTRGVLALAAAGCAGLITLFLFGIIAAAIAASTGKKVDK